MMRHLYAYGGSLIASNLPLPELSRAATGNAGFCFQLCSAASPKLTTVSAYTHRWQTPNGQTTLAYTQCGSDHLLQFPDSTTFIISQNGASIACYPAPNLPESTIRHYLLDQVLPRLLSQQKRLVLHASALL